MSTEIMTAHLRLTGEPPEAAAPVLTKEEPP